jgi:hypothetical protein
VATADVGVEHGVQGGVGGVALPLVLLLLLVVSGAAEASPTLCLLTRTRGMVEGTASAATWGSSSNCLELKGSYEHS